MKDGELVEVTAESSGIDQFPNSSGAIARRGNSVCLSAVCMSFSSGWLLRR